ncbi:phage major capsid protein [Buttiauxella noackiae]|uniref:phage major capsid family protein n=1 Tax=Buttiauxella noackiae TaxID=82992 RepID=UPI0005532946|nr:phage major capsid protein [Buttiauxella noackiae]
MILRRNLTVAARDLSVETDEQGDYFNIRFSSEYPVNREVYDQYGDLAVYGEVLLHGSDNADLTRLNDGVASLLFNHDHNQHLGIIIPGSAYIDVNDKAGYAKIRFSKVGNLANEIAEKVREGTISNISFGYSLDNYSFDDENKQILVDRWSVNEISFVTVPADPTVGLIRSENGSLNIIRKGDNAEINKKEIKTMPKRATEEEILEQEEVIEQQEEIISEEEAEVEEEIADEEGRDISAEEEEAEAEAVEVTAASVAEEVIKILDEREKRSLKNKKVRNVMTTKKDTLQNLERSFDLIGAIKAKTEGRDLKGANLEYHQEAERKLGSRAAARSGNTVHIPTSVLRAAPAGAQASSTVTAVQDDILLRDSFVDLLLKDSIIGKMNVQRLNGLTEAKYLIPRATSSAVDAFGFITEGQDAPIGKSAFDNVSLTPKTFAGEVVMNRRTLLTTPGIQAILSKQIIDRSREKLEAAMFGTTDLANAPKSLLNIITALKTGTADWDYKNFLASIAAMTDRGVSEEAIMFAMRGATLAELKSILKDDQNAISSYIVGDDGKLAGRPIASSGIFGSDEMLFGDFSGIMMGEWDGLTLDVDPWTEARNGGVCLRLFTDLDWTFVGQENSLVHLKRGTVTK